MAVLNIAQFRGASVNSNVVTPVYRVPEIASANLTFTTSTQSAVFDASTGVVRLTPDADCHVAFGTNPTATTASIRILAGIPTDFYLDRTGLKVAAITGA